MNPHDRRLISDDLQNDNVSIIFLMEVPKDTWFRYRKHFYYKINDQEAIKQGATDKLSDFLEISIKNKTDAVAISAMDYFIMEKEQETENKKIKDKDKEKYNLADQDGFDREKDFDMSSQYWG